MLDSLRPSARLAAGTTPPSFATGLRAFADFGEPTAVSEDDGIPYFTNEFWTAGQRQAHALHEVSYRACFKPQLPAFFIERLTIPGDAVHDPFMGRGTTPIEAALCGRRPVGGDVNPLSVLLTRPRLAPPNPAVVAARLATVPWDRASVNPDGLLAFYSPATLRQIGALRAWLMEREAAAKCDAVDDWIRMVALNRLSGHSQGFFSVYTMPPNQAVSIAAQRRINARRQQVPPDRDVAALILRKTRALLADGAPVSHPPPLLMTAPADATPRLADASVTLVVTSPPFLDIVQYADDNWLRCWFAGIDVAAVPIARHRDPAAWQAMVRAVLAELARVVRDTGHVAFEVGEVRGGRVLLERLVWEAAAGLPFDRLCVMVNQQAFTKTANCWGVRNNAGGTNSNRIVVLRRRPRGT